MSAPWALPDRWWGGLDDVQPFYANFPCGHTLAHNGNLTNSERLRRSSSATSPSEHHVGLQLYCRLRGAPAANLEARDEFGGPRGRSCRLQYHQTRWRPGENVRRCGGYAAGLGAQRRRAGLSGPRGIRPMVFGERKSRWKTSTTGRWRIRSGYVGPQALSRCGAR